MKRKNSKALLTVLALILALSTLIACQTSSAGSKVTEKTDESFETVTYSILKDGTTEFTMIRPDEIDRELYERIALLRTYINQKYNVSITSAADRNSGAQGNDPVKSDSSVHEILIGATNREESRLVASEHKDLQGFVVRVVNGKIILWGSDLLQTMEAIRYFEESLLTTDTPTVEEGFCFISDLNGAGAVCPILVNEFTVVYPSARYSRDLSSVNAVTRLLRTVTGKRASSISDADAVAGKELLIGSTNREQSVAIGKNLNYMDYYVKVSSDCVVLIGGSPLATENAVNHFLNAIKTYKITSLDQGYEYSYDFDPMIKDSLMYQVDAFVPAWKNDFAVPDWMTDFEEKLYAMTCPDGRLTSDSHRGDLRNYPENSLPAILSAIMLGADVIEIDVRLTKDNIMVLMHDESLERTTNWGMMQGKNGLPTSAKVQDWTYEQLLQLNLKHNDSVTQYKIPTAYEVVSLFGGRTQIHFDSKIASIDKYSDVYLLAEEVDAKECFIYYYGIETMKRWASSNPEDTEFAEIIARVDGYLARPNHGLRKRNFDLIAQYGDNEEGWIKQYESGCKMVFTDKIYDLCYYIAQSQEPIPR